MSHIARVDDKQFYSVLFTLHANLWISEGPVKRLNLASVNETEETLGPCSHESNLSRYPCQTNAGGAVVM